MELTDDFGQFKSEFAQQIAMEEEKARNLNIWVLKGQHSLKRGTSESVLGNGKRLPTVYGPALNNSKLHGSVGSLPSLALIDHNLVDKEENWVTSDQFKDILEKKEKEIFQNEHIEETLKKEISKEDLKRLEEENAELRKRLEFAGRRSSSVSLMGRSKFQELERDVTKLQAKICKMEQSSEDPSYTRRLVTFLETFKSQLPIMDSPRDEKYDSVLDRTLPELYRPSIGSYRPSIDSYGFGRPSMGSYRAACHPTPNRDDLFRPQPSRADSCVAQFRRVNGGVEGFEVVSDRAESFGALLAPEDWSSLKFDRGEETEFDDEARLVKESKPIRTCFPRSRVVMGAKTVQRARYLGGRMGESCRAFSSSDLLGESRIREEEFLSSAEEVFGERTPQSLNRSMQSRSKSYSNVLTCRDATEVACSDSGRGTDEASRTSHSSLEMEKVQKGGFEVIKIKGKDENKVLKFFKHLKKLVSKETKVSQEEDLDIKGTRKMTRSLSHRIGKSKNLPKRLKSFHCSSSPRLRKDFHLN